MASGHFREMSSSRRMHYSVNLFGIGLVLIIVSVIIILGGLASENFISVAIGILTLIWGGIALWASQGIGSGRWYNPVLRALEKQRAMGDSG